MKRLFIRAMCAAAVIGLFAGNTANAQADIDNTAYGSTATEFLLLGAGARGAALGGSFATITNDVDAMYWNPGGLATRLGGKCRLAQSVTNSDREQAPERNMSWIRIS